MFHDTYYVVAHGNYLLSLLCVLAIFIAAWFTILRVSPHQSRKHAAIAGAAFALGALCSLASLIAIFVFDPVHTDLTLFNTANRIATIGSVIILATLLTTAVIFVRTMIDARRRP